MSAHRQSLDERVLASGTVRFFSETWKGLPATSRLGSILTALFLLSGRWSLARITAADDTLFLQPRTWLVALLVLLALLVSFDRNWTRRHSTGGMLVALTAFVTFGLASTVWSPDFALASTKAAELVLILIVSFCVFLLADRSDPSKFGLACLIVIAGVTVLMGIAALPSALSMSRLSVFGGGPNVFARNNALAFCLAVYLYVTRRARGAGLALAIFTGAMTVLSGSRGGIVSATAGFLAVVYGTRVKFTRLAIALLVLGLAGALAIMYTDLGSIVAGRFYERFVRLTLVARYTAGRTETWRNAIEMGNQNMIFGAGISAFNAEGFGTYPHNIFLEAYSELGLTGVALLSFSLAFVANKIFRHPMTAPPPVEGAWMACLASAQFSGDLFDSRGIFVLGVVISMTSAPRGSSHRHTSEIRHSEPRRTE